jgi:hypothetical protein
MVCSFVDNQKIQEWIDICRMMKGFDTLVCFKFTPDELTIQMVHITKYCVLEMRFPSTWFSTYEWIDQEFYLDTDSLHTIFSLYSGEKMISMEQAKRTLTIKFFHEDQTKHFSLPIQFQRQSILCIQPNQGFDCLVSPSYFKSLCEQLSQFGNSVTLTVRPDIFHMSTYRTEKMLVEVNPDRIQRITEAELEETFELYYLLMFFNFASFHPKVSLRLSEYLHLSMEKEYVIHYYVSPRP